MPVASECCALSGRGLCNQTITCPEESYRLRCVIVGDQLQLYSSTPAVGQVEEVGLKKVKRITITNNL